jgi:predicted nucleic acid-binding protein
MKRYTHAERHDLERAFDVWAGRGRLLDFDGTHFTQARRMLMRHDRLRAPDALHLAIAKANELELATLDGPLRQAALAEGMRVTDL